MKRKVIFPGTFDPITTGHLSLIQQASALFDEIVIGVAEATGKQTLLTYAERVRLVTASVQAIPGASVKGYTGLTADFYRAEGACALVRGVRGCIDREYESQLAYANQALHHEIRTVFLMPALSVSYVSASMVREVARAGGDVSRWVPEGVVAVLAAKV